MEQRDLFFLTPATFIFDYVTVVGQGLSFYRKHSNVHESKVDGVIIFKDSPTR